jgi:hypothetical protein
MIDITINNVNVTIQGVEREQLELLELNDLMYSLMKISGEQKEEGKEDNSKGIKIYKAKHSFETLDSDNRPVLIFKDCEFVKYHQGRFKGMFKIPSNQWREDRDGNQKNACYQKTGLFPYTSYFDKIDESLLYE